MRRAALPCLLVLVLVACRTPAPAAPAPAVDPATLVAAEEALFAAIAARDATRLGRLVGDDFVLRVPGAPDVGKAAFLAGIAGIPGEIESVRGEQLAASPLGGERGLVSGVQVSRVRIDGVVVEDRQAFVDVFERRGDAWVLTFAFSVAVNPAP